MREKDDKSPVTEADVAAETVILEMLRTLTPDIPTVSEEAMSEGDNPDVSGARFWLIDPLDGTREFLSRNGEFTVNIALDRKGRPNRSLGVVLAPALDKVWWGAQRPWRHAARPGPKPSSRPVQISRPRDPGRPRQPGGGGEPAPMPTPASSRPS